MCCLKYENDIYMEFRKGMPDIGERVKTPDGVAKVIDTNLLERSVKVRLYVDEKPKGKRGEEEKLSADIYTYKKEEIRRIDRRKSSKNEDIFEGVDADTMKEIKELIKD